MSQASADVDRWFTFHPVKPEPHPERGSQAGRYEEIREQGRQMARYLLHAVPPGPERKKAIRHLRAAVMWANAGIACNE